MAEQPNVEITTPTGVSQYPWLSKPDTKWVEEGEYKTNLILSEADAKPLIETINKVFAENVKGVAENIGGEVKTASPPYAAETNDVGNEPTGNIIFRFKSKYPPRIFDAANKPLSDTNIWGGSELRVNAQVIPWYSKMIGAGVKLQLSAVQVIKYVEGGTPSADNFGFKPVEGFVQPIDSASEVFEEPAPVEEPAKLNAESLPQSDLVFDQPVLKDSGKPVIEKPADVDDIVKKWSVKN